MAEIEIGKKDVIWSYLGTFFRVSTNIIILPLLIYYLTAEELGLWYVFASIAQMVVLFDFGFAPTFARNISYTWSGAAALKSESISIVDNSDVNWEEFKIILRSCSLVYLIISTFAFLLLISVGSIYIIKIATTKYIVSWIVYSVAVFFNILFGFYTSFLRGVGAVAQNNIACTISKIGQLLFCFVFLFLGYGLLGVSIAYLISGLLLRLVSKYYFEKYSQIGENLRNTRVKNVWSKCINKIKIIWHNASRDGLVTLSNYLSTQANTLICSSVIGLESTGSYGMSIQIATLIGSIAGIPFSAYQTKMQGNAVKGRTIDNFELFSMSMILFVTSFLILSVLSFVCFPIISLIKPSFDINPYLYGLILIQMAAYYIYTLSASFISAYNVIPYTKAFIYSSLITVLLSFILAKYTSIGIWALALSPVIVSLYNMWRWPTYVFDKILHTNLCDFFFRGVQGCMAKIKFM